MYNYFVFRFYRTRNRGKESISSERTNRPATRKSLYFAAEADVSLKTVSWCQECLYWQLFLSKQVKRQIDLKSVFGFQVIILLAASLEMLFQLLIDARVS